MSHEITTQVLCGATLGMIAAGRLFIRGQVLDVSEYLRNAVKLRHIALSKLLFLGGLVAAGTLLSSNDSATLEPISPNFPIWRSALAGILVGLGSSLAKGCEIAHGVCGLSAFSPKSILFSLLALASASISSKFFSSSELIQSAPGTHLEYSQETVSQAFSLLIFSALAMAVAGFFGQKDDEEARRGVDTRPQNFALYGGDISEGILFAYAAALGGFAKPSLVIAGLDFQGPNFSPALIYILLSALVASFPAYMCVFRILKSQQSFSGAKNPILSDSVSIFTVLGAVCFGLGWGLGGMSPVSSLLNLSSGTTHYIVFFATLMGAYFAS